MAADELLLRQAPHSPQAEQAVLGSMLIDPDCIKDVMDKLRPEDFYLRANRDIFETIYHMFVYSRPIDGVTVAGEMEKTGVYNDNTRDYLLQLMDVTPTSANVMEYVQIVLDKSLMRQVASAAGSISAMVLDGAGDAGDMLEAAEQKVYAIRRGRSAQNMVPVSMVLEDVMAHLAELTASGGKTLPGLSTGLSAVDAKINGLNKSDLLLLAARPGMGKTSMALNVALSAARESGKTVAIFSLEMSKEQLVTRLIASEGLVENTRLVTGNLRESDWQRIAEAASSLSRMDIRIDDNPLLTVADMNAKCRRLDNLGLVVIDYLQLMTSAGGKGYSGENRQQAVSDISRMLKIMAKELQVPVLCLSQLSRANEKRDDKRPMLSDLRESGAIEQDADIVLFLYRDDYYNSDSEKRNVAECIVAKNRHGETGKVELRWMPEYTAFGTLENRYDDEE
ncbi:MAG: replicative DNA helicase [Oscillospiraceae bacterium]|jgi:replicative DNA helicase|nr:replicative DNA helicase [Oscillospiraceae bacterium]